MARAAINWLKNKGKKFRDHPKVQQFLKRERVKRAVGSVTAVVGRLKGLNRKAIIGVFILVFAWNVAFSIYKFPLAVSAQLFFYRLLWSAQRSPQYNATVKLVRIDDALHWSQPYQSPISRHLLAQLVKNASQIKHKAAVIALDVELYTPNESFVPKDQRPARTADDEEFLRVVNDAARAGVKVIFPAGFGYEGRIRKRIPNIYQDEELPLADEKGRCGYEACAVLGYINLPPDEREIPLEKTLVDGSTGSKQTLRSLALAAAEAKAGQQFRKQRPQVREAIMRQEPLFGGFLPESAFQGNEISAQQLASGDEEAQRQVDGNVIVIGGIWHRNQGYGPPEDLHQSPVGYMPGVILHSNYIEALLCDHYTKEFPLSAGIIFDIAIGLAIYSTFRSRGAWWKQLLILVFLAFASYVAFVNFNRYLDFVLPSLLYFAHLLYEHTKRYVELARPSGNEKTT
jgi:CHASE2 domain-containing sensor protein